MILNKNINRTDLIKCLISLILKCGIVLLKLPTKEKKKIELL